MLRSQKSLLFPLTLLALVQSQSAFAVSNSAEYTVSGTTVTGSGTSSTAFFNGTAGLGYDITIQTGANLNSAASVRQIQADHGTLLNQSGATLGSGAGADATIAFTGAGGTGSITNAGTINGGGNTNTIYMLGNGVLNNSGTIGIVNGYAVDILGDAQIVNSGTIKEGSFNGGLNLGNSGAAAGSGGTTSVNNLASGIIVNAAPGGAVFARGVNIFNSSNGTVINAGAINANGFLYAIGVGFTGVTTGTIENSGVINIGRGATYGGYGISAGGSSNIGITNSGAITLNGTGAAYGGFFLSDHDMTLNNSNLIDVVTSGAEAHGVYMDATTHDFLIRNSGIIHGHGGSSISNGITALAGSNAVTVNNNAGTIIGDNYGVYLAGNNSMLTTTTGGHIEGGTAAIGLAGTNNVVNIRGQSHIVGVIEGNTASHGTPLTDNTLNLYLNGLTSSQISAFNTAITNAGAGAGTFTIGPDTYSWDSFATVNLAAVSGLQLQVDSGLRQIAGKIDALPSGLSADFDSFYLAAPHNPETALNALTGRQMVSAYGTMTAASTRSLGELTDSRASALQDQMSGTDAGAGTSGGVLSTTLVSTSLMHPNPEANRWGAWIDNSLTFTHQDTTSNGPGYHGTIETPTIGLDFRATPDFTIGSLAHVQVANSDFKDGSHAKLKSALIGTYGVYTHDSWFANGLLGVGYNDYDNRRVALNGESAESSPGGKEFLANIGGGYTFKCDGWTFGPVGGLQYSYIGVDSYNEEGAGAMNLRVSDQDINSLRSRLGVRVSSSFNTSNLKLTPNLSASWYHDLLDGNNRVDESLAGAPELGEFGVQSTGSTRDFGMLGFGLSAKPTESRDDITLYVNYTGQVSRDYTANTVYGGVRFNF